MKKTLLYISGIAGFLLFALDIYGFVAYRYGPIGYYRSYRTNLEATRAQGLKACKVCGRPGEGIPYITTGPGAGHGGTTTVHVYCEEHTTEEPHVGIVNITCWTGACGVLALAGASILMAGPFVGQRILGREPILPMTSERFSAFVSLAFILLFGHVGLWANTWLSVTH